MIVGEYPGLEDEQQGAPMVGWSGQELSKMLQEAGIFRAGCFVTSVIRIRPPNNDIDNFIARIKKDVTKHHIAVRDKMCLPPVYEGIDLLKREIEMCRPNVIIALGNIAFWALTGNWGITSWRGSTVQTDLELALDYKPKVLAAYNPSIVMRQWSWRQIAVMDFRRAMKESASREYEGAHYRFVTRPLYSTALEYLDLLQRAVEAKPTKLAVDIETRAGHIACIGIAWSKQEAICFPLMCVERPEGYWSAEEEAEICWRLQRLLTNAQAVVIGQNFSYDAQYFHRWLRFLPRLARDTMIAQHACFSAMQKSLDFLSSMYCEKHVYWKDDGKTWDEGTGEDQLWRYNCEDAVKTYEVDEEQQKTVDKLGLREPHDFQQSLFWPVLETMNRGIRVAAAKRGAFAMMLSDEIAKREQWLIDTVGYNLNPASPKQMAEFFYGELNFKVIKGDRGNPTCDDEALNKLAGREPLVRPLVRKITELRSLNVFLSTFVNAPLDRDGRIRCSFNIAGTETYRFSSSKNAFGSGLNLQNIPKGGETEEAVGALELPNIRELFIPDPGMEFFDIDLDSADLQIVAAEAGLSEMKAMIREKKKVYVEVMKEYYKDPSMTKEHRQYTTFKSLCHGTNYLGTAKGLAERLGLSVHETDKVQKWYYGKFPGLKRWQDDVKEQVMKRRMVQNIWGYRRYYFDRIEGTIFNQAIAWIPQSSIGILINHAYVNIYNNVPEVQVLLQVHDSLAGQKPINRPDLTEAIRQNARIPLPYDEPLIIDVGLKTSTASWGACG